MHSQDQILPLCAQQLFHVAAIVGETESKLDLPEVPGRDDLGGMRSQLTEF